MFGILEVLGGDMGHLHERAGEVAGAQGDLGCGLGLLTVPPAHPQSFSSLQTSTSARRWAALSLCACTVLARTQRAPTAATAHRAMWPWPGPTTACPRQPRAQQQRSSRGAEVRVLPSGM